MRRKLASFLTVFLARLGFKISRTQLLEKSDDPYHILSRLLTKETVKIIIDGGASIGHTSEKLSLFFPKSKVFAFEPLPPFFEKLQEKANETENITAMQFALDKLSGTNMLHVNESEGTSSFFETSDFGEETYGQLLKRKKSLNVNTITLDDFADKYKIENIDLLKMDLQGNELAAIEGAKYLLKKGAIKCILCEVIYAPHYLQETLPCNLISELIDKHNFHLFNFFQPNYHNGRLLQNDALFIHNSILNEVSSRSSCIFHSHSNLLK